MKSIIKFIVFMVGVSCSQLSFGYVPAQIRALKKAISSRDGDQVINCAGCDLRGTKALAGLDAHGVHMPGVTFQPCVKSSKNKSTTMVCIEKQKADLTGINLAKGNGSRSCIDEAILDKSDLTDFDFTEGSAIGASLLDAKVTGLISLNATFCNAIMPDGKVCDEKLKTWTGQGTTINCNCVKGGGGSKKK